MSQCDGWSKGLTRRRRIIIGAAGVLLLIAVGLGLALPTIAGLALERKLEDALSKRELDATWQELDVDWRGRLRFKTLKISDPERGIEATLDEVLIRPALKTMLSEQPKINSIELKGLRATAAIDPWLDRQDKSEPKKPKNPNSLSARLKRSLQEHPPSIKGSALEIGLTYKGHALATGKVPTLQIDEDDGLLKMSVEGTVVPSYDKLPSLLRVERSWKIDGELSVKSRSAKVKIASPQERTPLLALELARVGRVVVGAVNVDVSLDAQDRHAVMHLANIEARLGDKDEIIAAFSAADVTADVMRPKPLLQLSQVYAEVSPQRLGRLRELKEKLKPPAVKVVSAVKSSVKDKIKDKLHLPKAAAKAPSQTMALAVRLIDQLWRVDASVEGASLAIRLADEDDEAKDRLVTLAQGLYIESKEGLIWARGSSSEGDFSGHIEFVPGQLLPRMATIKVNHVNIGKLPGMEEGRTLPNRGIRGRVGGLVDLSASFHSPLDLGAISPTERHTLNVSAKWADGLIELHGLADEPLTGINASGQATLEWEPALKRISIKDAHVKYGPVRGYADGELLDWPLKPKLKLTAGLEELNCQDLWRAIPDAMTGPYRNAILNGRFAPRVQIKYPLDDPWKFEWDWTGLAFEDDKPRWEERTPPEERQWLCQVKHLRTLAEARPEILTATARRLNTTDVGWLKEPFVRQVIEGVSEDAEIIVGPGTESYVRLETLPGYVGGAAYLTEEILFPTNRGINLALIAKAIRINLERGRFVYGGSTVTQQLVKNLFLTRNKTLSRKVQEALIAFRLDEAVSKNRLLELYINMIEFGKDLYGIEPAAQFYFQRPARLLTPLQAVFLANIKPSPSMGNRFKRKGTTPEKGHFPERTETIFKRMLERDFITPQQLEQARPFVLKWDAQGNYIDPAPSGLVPLRLDPLEPPPLLTP